MRKAMTFFMVFVLMMVSADLFAESKNNGELSFCAGLSLGGGINDIFGAANLGYYSKNVGLEAHGALNGGVVIIGGNLVVEFFDAKRVVPFVTGGIWTTTFRFFGFDVGGGIKVSLSKASAFRVEYRRYFFGNIEWGANSLIGGISLFF
ncbi:MAG: hypothetical protein JXB26_19815 [Candidatus Aminicenantes bacterium]|nr:hypothetical protein [Candidatus Aminicenantes bacterium]